MLGLEGQPRPARDNKIIAARALRREGHLDPVLRARGPADHLARSARSAARSPSSCATWTGASSTTWSSTCRPGTSDAQLTLAQAVPISGAVLVTTPQEVALLGRRQGARHVPAAERAGPRDRREHDAPSSARTAARRPRSSAAAAASGSRSSTASSSWAGSRSTSPSARAATSACRPWPSASPGRPPGPRGHRRARRRADERPGRHGRRSAGPDDLLRLR